MNPIINDLMTYGIPLVAGAVGIFAGHKLTLKKVETAIAELGPNILKLAEKLAADAKAVAVAPIHAIENAPGTIEAHKTDAQNVMLETVKYALLGLTTMKTAYGSMNDAEKYALAQFVSNSLDAVLPASMKVHVTPTGIATGIEEAQKLLDGTSTNPVLLKALELTKLAAAVNAPKVEPTPAPTPVVEPTPAPAPEPAPQA